MARIRSGGSRSAAAWRFPNLVAGGALAKSTAIFHRPRDQRVVADGLDHDPGNAGTTFADSVRSRYEVPSAAEQRGDRVVGRIVSYRRTVRRGPLPRIPSKAVRIVDQKYGGRDPDLSRSV